MVGRDIVVLLESEARRRPVIADLLARVETLSDSEIDNSAVPLKWYKDALREARRRKLVASAQAQYLVAATHNPIDPNEPRGGENAKYGITLEYTGNTFWAKSSGRTEYEVRTGDWLFFPEDGSGAWLNTTFFAKSPPQLAQSKEIARGTRGEYVIAYNSRIDTLVPAQEVKPPYRIYRTPEERH